MAGDAQPGQGGRIGEQMCRITPPPERIDVLVLQEQEEVADVPGGAGGCQLLLPRAHRQVRLRRRQVAGREYPPFGRGWCRQGGGQR